MSRVSHQVFPTLIKIANCKCLYGPDIEVITFSFGGNYQAAAMRFDPFTASWTRYLHTKHNAPSSHSAILGLLEKTESELATLFSANGIIVPFSGNAVQIMTLHRGVQRYSDASSSELSDDSTFEFIATPGSSLVDEAIAKEATPDEIKVAEPEAENESAMHESWQCETLAAEEAPCEPCAPVCVETEAPCEEPKSEEEVVYEPPCEESMFEEEDRPEEESVSVCEERACEEPLCEDAVPVYDEPDAHCEPYGSVHKEPKPVSEGPSALELQSDAPKDVHDFGWGSFGTSKKDKKKKSKAVFEDIPTPGPEPEAPADDFGWGSFSTKKGKKTKGKAAFDEPSRPEPEPEALDDDLWNFTSISTKNKKKKGKIAVEEPPTVEEARPEPEKCFAEPVLAVEIYEAPPEPESEPKEMHPEIQLDPEPQYVIDDIWGSARKKDKKKKGKSTTYEVPITEEQVPDPEPVVEDDAWGSWGSFIKKGNKGKGKLHKTPAAEISPPFEEPFVETLEAPPTQEVEPSSVTDVLVPEEISQEVTTHHPQTQAVGFGQTVVVTIRHPSKTSDLHLHLMVTLADNTLKAIFDAVNSYLDSKSPSVPVQGLRKLEIKYGTGKKGDVDLSALEESKWPEYLEYFGQCTRFPELTVDVLGFFE